MLNPDWLKHVSPEWLEQTNERIDNQTAEETRAAAERLDSDESAFVDWVKIKQPKPSGAKRRCLDWLVLNEESCGELNAPEAVHCVKCGKKLYAAMDDAEKAAWAEQFNANLPKETT